MLTIDGSFGEGGGQILRSSLTLALMTGTAFEIDRIRAGRKQPGLRPQHLRSVAAAATVSHAAVQGAEVGSQHLRFEPGPVTPGHYHFRIGTAGATSLVLQTIHLPLALAHERSVVTIAGGTHVPWSPAYHYLSELWLGMLELMGLCTRLTLEQAGFYPKGGGTIRAEILSQAGKPIRSITQTYRGALVEVTGISAVANLPDSVGERQRRRAAGRLDGLHIPHAIDLVRLPAMGKGTVLCLVAQFAQARSCHVALGAPGKPAERVADEALDDLLAHLHSNACLDRHLADQVLLPLAFAEGPSVFTTERITDHLTTNAEVIRQFLPARIDIRTQPDGTGRVAVEPA